MPGKRIKTSKPEVKLAEGKSKPKDLEQIIKDLIERGKKQGHLTYEEMNDYLPEEAVSPTRLDSLLAALGEQGITLMDEADVKKSEEEDADFIGDDDEELQGPAKSGVKEDEILEKELVGAASARRIDDPIRMYLTQMGEIPLLTRKEEITLARKIELSRMAFRRKMLESDYCARNVVDILQKVDDGIMSFDRTMKISTSENLVRGVIKKRLPANLNTVNKY